MNLAELTVSPEWFWAGNIVPEAPCWFIIASESQKIVQPFIQPACPVIAIGEPDAGLLAICDLVAEDVIAAEKLLRNISANPRAAAVTVQLLRLLPAMTTEAGLIAESMAYGVLQAGEEHARWRDARGHQEQAAAGQVHLTRTGDALEIAMVRSAADNAIDRVMRDGLFDGFRMAALDHSITRICLRGLGRSFSLGADLAEFGTTRDPVQAHLIRQQSLPAIWALQCIDRLEAHVQGACVGAGLELAAYARRLTASSRAWFQLPELAMGLLPGAGGCVSLVRRIGRHRTAELILSGRRLSARQALVWGLVDAIMHDPAADPGGTDVI